MVTGKNSAENQLKMLSGEGSMVTTPRRTSSYLYSYGLHACSSLACLLVYSRNS
jgi:hypothetical protein